MVEVDAPSWRDRYLTLGWNNTLTVALAVPMLAFAAVVLSGSAISDRTAFIGMVFIGAVY